MENELNLLFLNDITLAEIEAQNITSMTVTGGAAATGYKGWVVSSTGMATLLSSPLSFIDYVDNTKVSELTISSGGWATLMVEGSIQLEPGATYAKYHAFSDLQATGRIHYQDVTGKLALTLSPQVALTGVAGAGNLTIYGGGLDDVIVTQGAASATVLAVHDGYQRNVYISGTSQSTWGYLPDSLVINLPTSVLQGSQGYMLASPQEGRALTIDLCDSTTDIAITGAKLSACLMCSSLIALRDCDLGGHAAMADAAVMYNVHGGGVCANTVLVVGGSALAITGRDVELYDTTGEIKVVAGACRGDNISGLTHLHVGSSIPDALHAPDVLLAGYVYGMPCSRYTYDSYRVTSMHAVNSVTSLTRLSLDTPGHYRMLGAQHVDGQLSGSSFFYNSSGSCGNLAAFAEEVDLRGATVVEDWAVDSTRRYHVDDTTTFNGAPLSQFYSNTSVVVPEGAVVYNGNPQQLTVEEGGAIILISSARVSSALLSSYKSEPAGIRQGSTHGAIAFGAPSYYPPVSGGSSAVISSATVHGNYFEMNRSLGYSISTLDATEMMAGGTACVYLNGSAISSGGSAGIFCDVTYNDSTGILVTDMNTVGSCKLYYSQGSTFFEGSVENNTVHDVHFFVPDILPEDIQLTSGFYGELYIQQSVSSGCGFTRTTYYHHREATSNASHVGYDLRLDGAGMYTGTLIDISEGMLHIADMWHPTWPGVDDSVNIALGRGYIFTSHHTTSSWIRVRPKSEYASELWPILASVGSDTGLQIAEHSGYSSVTTSRYALLATVASGGTVLPCPSPYTVTGVINGRCQLTVVSGVISGGDDTFLIQGTHIVAPPAAGAGNSCVKFGCASNYARLFGFNTSVTCDAPVTLELLPGASMTLMHVTAPGVTIIVPAGTYVNGSVTGSGVCSIVLAGGTAVYCNASSGGVVSITGSGVISGGYALDGGTMVIGTGPIAQETQVISGGRTVGTYITGCTQADALILSICPEASSGGTMVVNNYPVGGVSGEVVISDGGALLAPFGNATLHNRCSQTLSAVQSKPNMTYLSAIDRNSGGITAPAYAVIVYDVYDCQHGGDILESNAVPDSYTRTFDQLSACTDASLLEDGAGGTAIVRLTVNKTQNVNGQAGITMRLYSDPACNCSSSSYYIEDMGWETDVTCNIQYSYQYHPAESTGFILNDSVDFRWETWNYGYTYTDSGVVLSGVRTNQNAILIGEGTPPPPRSTTINDYLGSYGGREINYVYV